MTQCVDPALDVLTRALHGDHGALAFLDRTSSIYLLDATDPSKPKTYGGWNFIHQAMNEIERNEASRQGTTTSTNINTLTGQVQLLATMAQRVARKSPAMDRSLVSTCITNASASQYPVGVAEKLIDLNAEIREIVMGRIAAMAFDFSFHHRQGTATNNSNTRSAFSDPVAMEKLCSVLAANAVASGPNSVNHFMKEWIIPSLPTLPQFAVACVTYHLALESLSSKASPAGTKDVLQRISHPVVGSVITPVLAEAIAETSSSDSNTPNNHEWNCRVAAISLRALERWCTATDLSLPQVKHICAKHQMNFVSVISDALYSDSDLVVEAMAELMDTCVVENKEGKVSQERMTQARYIMEVDEVAFRSVTAVDLYRIEVKEMEDVLGELVTAVGLQRFRFSERQQKGDHAVCRNLTRIAARVGAVSMVGLISGQIPGGGSGLLELLMKAGSHPYVYISSLAIEVLSRLLELDPSFPQRLLPLLQHRAIIPYVLHGSVPSLSASVISGVDFYEFENFRQNVLVEVLVACYEQNANYYMDSCTSAVEEFCSSSATVEVSFQLEAALFCLTAVAITVNSPGECKHSAQLSRCTRALATKPAFLPANPLALAQLNRFLGMYGSWYTGQAPPQALEVAFELSVSTINMSGTAFSEREPASEMLKEMAISPFSEAAKATRIFLTRSPKRFSAPNAMSSLGGAWETTYVACNRGMLTIEDREEICNGICAVVAAMPASHREKPYHAFALPVVECMHAMCKRADDSKLANDGTLAAVIPRLTDEVRLLSTMVKSLTVAIQKSEKGVEGQNGSHGNALLPSVGLLKKLWPCLTHIATTYANDKTVSEALGYFLVSCVPPQLDSDESVALVKELFALAKSMIPEDNANNAPLLAVSEFMERVVDMYGSDVEAAALQTLDKSTAIATPDLSEETGRLLEELLLASIQAAQNTLGTAWTLNKVQGQGQLSFESKTKPESEEKPTATDVLASIFSVLIACSKNCPTFLVYLPATPGGDRDDDRMISRAVDSAVSALVEPDFDVARTAILFLKSTIELMSTTTSQALKYVVEQIIARVRGMTVSILIAGACGGFHPTLLDPAASLLYLILHTTSSEQVKTYYEAALSQEQFKIGDPARMASANFLAKCATREVSNVALMEFAEELWELHQHNEAGSVSESDQVVAFIKKIS